MRQLSACRVTIGGLVVVSSTACAAERSSNTPPDQTEYVESDGPQSQSRDAAITASDAAGSSEFGTREPAATADASNVEATTAPATAPYPNPPTQAPKPGCKRGVAANVAPGPAFAPAVKWWYNWAIRGETLAGIEFVPMIWGRASAGEPIPEGSNFLLGFNEPNFFDQANASAGEAAAAWAEVERSADGVPVVGPGMNFCGPAERCHGTDPYQYLKDFYASCDGCQIDFVAVHWYNCDLPSLRDYLEPGGNLEGFEQFGAPIWLTEFSCNPSASVEEQAAFMREAIPYLESNPHVFRYAWFSAGPIPNAKLINDDGTPTPLGEVYIGLEQAPCE